MVTSLSLDQRHGPNGFLQLAHLFHGAHDEGGARVHDGLTACLAQGQAVAHVHPAGEVAMSSQGHLDPTVPTTAQAGRFLLFFLRSQRQAPGAGS